MQAKHQIPELDAGKELLLGGLIAMKECGDLSMVLVRLPFAARSMHNLPHFGGSDGLVLDPRRKFIDVASRSSSSILGQMMGCW